METKICSICKKELPITKFIMRKIHYSTCCVDCRPVRKWLRAYKRMVSRCCDPRNKFYSRYNAKGIKVLITPDDFRKLFFEQRADLMKSPTPHRVDNDGNYELGNIKFMEWNDHEDLHRKEKQNG